MAGWCRCGSFWKTPDVPRGHPLERSNRQHALVFVESHCPELLRKVQSDGDQVAAAGGNKR